MRYCKRSAAQQDRESSDQVKRRYLTLNVYDALQERLHYLFQEFDNILVSFSGGKDSGLLLNLVLDFQKKNYPDRKIGVFHEDFEAQYTVTTEYVERTFERIAKDVEPYWVCLPIATRTALSSYEMFWYPWDDTKEEIWVRPMPKHPYVVNLQNNPVTTYKYKMVPYVPRGQEDGLPAGDPGGRVSAALQRDPQ